LKEPELAATAPIYPDDPDGDALRAVADAGSDMSRPMLIDYAIDAGTRAVADGCLAVLEAAGFEPELFQDEETLRWSVYCPITMIADYDDIVRTQKVLGELVAPLGGTPDGWATLGNVEISAG
jgi:hypothetical protein